MLVLRAWIEALAGQWHILDHLLVLDVAIHVASILLVTKQWLLGLLVSLRTGGHLLL